jgi:AcrR family transcriptional regulator
VRVKTSGEAKRAYVQGRRAEAARETGERILAAAMALFLESGVEPTLDAVAARAEVAVQTVLRRYGSKEGLFAACLARGSSEVAAQRGAITPGDVPGAVRNLVAHYDEWGDRALRLLAMEDRGPAAAEVVASGRALHRDWVAMAFAPQLAACDARVRRRRLAQLVTVTDVYAWKLLHRDQGLSRADTRRALTELVEAVLRTPPEAARAPKKGSSR